MNLLELEDYNVQQIEALNASQIPDYTEGELEAGEFTEEQEKAIKKKKDPKKDTQGGQAGDPGIFFTLDFNHYTLPERVHWVNVDIFIDVPEKQNTRSLNETQVSKTKFQHHVSFTMDANNGPKDKPVRDNELDLSEPYTILVPFVDINWFEKKHHELDLRYRLEFKYNEIIDKVARAEEGVLPAGEVHEGPFAIKTDKDNLPSYMPWVQKIGDLHFDEVIYTEHGVWWKMHYVGNSPRPTYLFGEHGANSNFCPRPSAHGNYRVDEYESCFLPYPRLKNPNEPREKCTLMVGNPPNNIVFTPPAAFETQKGGWEIVGTSLTGSNHVAAQTRYINPLPLAEPHKAPKTYGATEAVSPQENHAASAPPEPAQNGFLTSIIDWIKSLFN